MNRQSTWDSVWPPLTLMYISAALKEAGFRTLILDANVLPEDELERSAREFSPRLSIVNTATPTFGADLEFSGKLKKMGSLVALVGVHPTALHKEVSEDSRVDFIVRGEPEETSRELALALFSGKGLSKVKGLSWKRESGKAVHNKERPFINNLDSLPWPDREGVDNSRYKMPFSGEPFAIINPSRGCPYSCTFCTASLFYGKSFRKRSPASVCNEISECVSKYGIRTFLFWSDEFTLDRKFVLALCGEIRKRGGLGIKWFANSRIDTCDPELFREMRRAGCFLVSFGIESSDQRILDLARKGTSVSIAKSAVLAAKRAGIETIGHFVFGLVGETEKSARETIRFSKELGLDYAQFYIATPYPGTPFHEYCSEKGLITEQNYSKMEISNAAIRQGNLSAQDLLRIRRAAYREFYSRPLFALKKGIGVLTKGGLFGARSAFRYLSDWGELGK